MTQIHIKHFEAQILSTTIHSSKKVYYIVSLLHWFGWNGRSVWAFMGDQFEGSSAEQKYEC